MNAIFSVVRSSAAMIMSPSFSREVESMTMINSPFPRFLSLLGLETRLRELQGRLLKRKEAADVLNVSIVSLIESNLSSIVVSEEGIAISCRVLMLSQKKGNVRFLPAVLGEQSVP